MVEDVYGVTPFDSFFYLASFPSTISQMTPIIPFCSHNPEKYLKSKFGGQEACFSNWYPSEFLFRVDKIYQYLKKKVPDEAKGKAIKFSNVEQGMMFGKAILFGDYETADKILKDPDPNTSRKLGRQVRGYVEDQWADVRYQYVRLLIYEKFRQNKDLRDFLVNTGSSILVEAAHYDKIWGVGIHIAHPDIQDPDKWRGQNLLGQCLMSVRKKLAAN